MVHSPTSSPQSPRRHYHSHSNHHHHRPRTNSIDPNLFDNEHHLEIGDIAIVLHRYRGQYGKVGVVTSAIVQYVWIQTSRNKIIQKRRDKVALYCGPTPSELQDIIDDLPHRDDANHDTPFDSSL